MKFWIHLFDLLRFYFSLMVLACICLCWSALVLLMWPFIASARGRALGRVLGRATISTTFRLFFAFLSWIGLIHFDIDSAEFELLNQQDSLILAANHPTLIDAVILISRLKNVGCIMKASVLKNPFLGVGARLAGYICNDSLRCMIRASIDDLKQGSQLLIFPEGTRTVHEPVNDFKAGFAMIARDAGVRVQTILIETDSPYTRKGWPVLRRPPIPMVYRVRMGECFEVSDNAAAFAQRLQAYFETALIPIIKTSAASAEAAAHTMTQISESTLVINASTGCAETIHTQTRPVVNANCADEVAAQEQLVSSHRS